MENENRIATPEENPAEEAGVLQGRIAGRKIRRYIRYTAFMVVVGLFYIWNSHTAEKQVRREDQLRKAVEVAKAEYKTIDAGLSARTRKPVVEAAADSLGLKVETQNVFKLKRQQ